jgi:hypothetical protein
MNAPQESPLIKSPLENLLNLEGILKVA